MGILTDDESLIDAALSEILALPVDSRLELDPQRNVDHLLIQHHLRLVNFLQVVYWHKLIKHCRMILQKL